MVVFAMLDSSGHWQGVQHLPSFLFSQEARLPLSTDMCCFRFAIAMTPYLWPMWPLQ